MQTDWEKYANTILDFYVFQRICFTLFMQNWTGVSDKLKDCGGLAIRIHIYYCMTWVLDIKGVFEYK